MRFAKLSREVELDADEQYPVNRRQILNDLGEESRLLRLALKLPTESGEYQWELLEPNLLLAHVVGSCPALQDVYRVALEAKPPTPERPWDLMACYDEFAPGDMLNYDNSRKTMVLAFNVEQLGTSWMVPIAVRSARINKVLGVWSHMLRRIFHVLLLADDLAHECACATQGMLAAEPSTATVGVTVVYHERTYVISVLGLRHSHRL